MRVLNPFRFFHLSIALGMALSSLTGASSSDTSGGACSRDCMTLIVRQVLDSMVAHDPLALPLATVYKATENSHPAALSMMTSWRTIVSAGPPSLLAIDTTNSTAYFALDVSEGDDTKLSVLRGRIKVVNKKITEIELFINRSRGDHGFSYSAQELPANYETLMSPPNNRTKASRAQLDFLSRSLFDETSDYSNQIGDECQFTEIGWKVVDTGVWGNASSTPLGCSWPASHPTDSNARTGLVIDEELGFVVTSGMISGKVYPYNGNVSAFIPDTMTSAQQAQDVWYDEMKKEGTLSMVAPTEATGETLEVLQWYNGKLQAMQINVYLSGPNMTSPWL